MTATGVPEMVVLEQDDYRNTRPGGGGVDGHRMTDGFVWPM